MSDKEQKFRDRVMFGDTGDYYPCDICDEMNFPHVSWHCTHDDPAHGTTVCHVCLDKINQRSKIS